MPEIRRIDLMQFKTEAKAGEVTDAAIIKSYVCDEVKALDVEPGHEQEARAFEFAISTETPDRENDAIAVDGWLLDAYRRNPVVLWAHSHSELPIAKSPDVWPRDAQLRAKADFNESYDIYPFSRMVAQMLSRKLLNAASVGFRPVVYAHNEARGAWAYDFMEQELLEWSIVPVPANAEALQGAKSLGIDIAPLAEWAEKVLDCDKGAGIWVPKELHTREYVEKAWRTARGESASVQVPDDTTRAASSPSKGTAGATGEPPRDVASAKPEQTKAGRVLSAANESALREAVAGIESAAQRISSVLSSAAPADDDAGGDDGKSASAQQTTAQPELQPISVDNTAMIETLKSLLPGLLRDITVEETERALAKVTGRVD